MRKGDWVAVDIDDSGRLYTARIIEVISEAGCEDVVEVFIVANDEVLSFLGSEIHPLDNVLRRAGEIMLALINADTRGQRGEAMCRVEEFLIDAGECPGASARRVHQDDEEEVS